MLTFVACDAQVRFVNIFHLVDEAELGSWQSGLYYVGYEPKQSADAVRQWLTQSGGTCAGTVRSWTPAGVQPATTSQTTTAKTITTAVVVPPPLPVIRKPSLELTAAPDGGTAPLTTKFTIKTNPAGLVTRWEMNFDDGSSDEGKGDPPDTITHTYRLGIRYDPDLTISFGNAKAEEHLFARVPVVVEPKEPFKFTVDVEKVGAGHAPLLVHFHPKYSWDEPPASWSIDCGDGKSQTGAGKLPATIPHTYAKNGTFDAVAKVKARDGHGKLFDAAVPLKIVVAEPPPSFGTVSGGPSWTVANGKLLVTAFDFFATWARC